MTDLDTCHIIGAAGQSVRTDSYDQSPAGSNFVTAYDADGNQTAHATAADWGDQARGETTMAALWTAVADETVTTDDYGPELSWNLGAGHLRACPHGTYVRFLDADGIDLDDGSAYWTSDEWVAEPQEVMGAILGAAASLQA